MSACRTLGIPLLAVAVWGSVARTASADEPAPVAVVTASPTSDANGMAAPERRDVRLEVPVLAYAYGARGSTAGTVGAQLTGLTNVGDRRPIFGGGAMVWGSPVDRLTLIGDAQRNVFGEFSPSAAAVVRILGGPQGWSLGGLGKFKASGFGSNKKGPNGEAEIEAEVETGLLLSYARRRLHLDLNAIAGFGLGDDSEVDSEARLRLGYDLSDLVRLGIDGQARYRLNGTFTLPGNRKGDFAVGPQVLFGTSRLYAALTAGPATMGISDRTLGLTAMVAVGGTN